MTDRESPRAARRERTIAVTVGPWGGVWVTGKRGLIWRLCLGFVAITYVPAEMTQILDVWMRSEALEAALQDIALNSPQGRTPEWFTRRAQRGLDGR